MKLFIEKSVVTKGKNGEEFNVNMRGYENVEKVFWYEGYIQNEESFTKVSGNSIEELTEEELIKAMKGENIQKGSLFWKSFEIINQQQIKEIEESDKYEVIEIA